MTTKENYNFKTKQGVINHLCLLGFKSKDGKSYTYGIYKDINTIIYRPMWYADGWGICMVIKQKSGKTTPYRVNVYMDNDKLGISYHNSKSMFEPDNETQIIKEGIK